MITADEAFARIQTHLRAVEKDPSVTLDTSLLRIIDTPISEALGSSQRHALLNQTSSCILSIQQDVAPITRLIDRLIEPQSCQFSDILQIRPKVDFARGLETISGTTVKLLSKACGSLENGNIIASDRSIVIALVKTWLSTPDIGVAEQTGKLLTNLLVADKSPAQLQCVRPEIDTNHMWRRIFLDEAVYRLFFAICSDTPDTEFPVEKLTKSQRGIAQGRLLDFLAILNTNATCNSQITSLEQSFGVENGTGLLGFACTTMIDPDDELMKTVLISFATQCIKRSTLTGLNESDGNGDGMDCSAGLSPGLEAMKRIGLHKTSLTYYLRDLSGTAEGISTWLLSDSASYLCAYCSHYEEDFLRDSKLIDALSLGILARFERLSKAAWSARQCNNNDLAVLSYMPSRTLFMMTPQGRTSILSRVPFIQSDPRVLKMLCAVFGTDGIKGSNRLAKRELYFRYVLRWPDFWSTLIKTAETIAIPDTAYAAIQLMAKIAEADWRLSNPVEMEDAKLKEALGLSSMPSTGMESILVGPGNALRDLFPYLLRSSRGYGSHGIGSSADSGNGIPTAWQAIQAKHDLGTVILHNLIGGRTSEESVARRAELDGLITALQTRLAQGPLGKVDHGSRDQVQVQTLEI